MIILSKRFEVLVTEYMFECDFGFCARGLRLPMLCFQTFILSSFCSVTGVFGEVSVHSPVASSGIVIGLSL